MKMPNKTISVEMLSPKDDYTEGSASNSYSYPSKHKENGHPAGSTSRFDYYRKKYKRLISVSKFLACNVILVVYFAFATKYFLDKGTSIEFCDGYGMLMLLFIFSYLLMFYYLIFLPHLYHPFMGVWNPTEKFLGSLFENNLVRWGSYAAIMAAVLVFLIVDSWGHFNRLIAVGGFFLLVLVGIVFSKHPRQIRARPVICGLFVQFALGLFMIRWEVGRSIFDCIGNKATTFMKYTDEGSAFVYGDDLVKKVPIFAFEAMSVIFFMCFVVQILYYYGIVQKVVIGLGTILQKIIGTTICESVNAAADIFLGLTESPILLQPYLQDLTKSELHAVMAGGFAAVSGTVLVAYINYGAKASHLITASVMSAPATLCYAKLFYPETEESKSTKDKIVMPTCQADSLLDAACQGASQGIEIVLGVIANVICFVAFVAFINGVLGWLGLLVGFDNWSVEELLSYVFMPLSFLMGIPWEEARAVGKLIGIKTVINEFNAYKVLGDMIRAGELSARSQAIATFAICGFSNPGSVGIMISTMSALIPGKRQVITSLVLRSFVTGAIVCFMTACIAGILYSDDSL